MSSCISIHIYLTTSINIRLTHGSRTTVANTRFHKKGQAYQKSCQKMFFGFPIKSHPIQKKSLYIHNRHLNKLPPNEGDKTQKVLNSIKKVLKRDSKSTKMRSTKVLKCDPKGTKMRSSKVLKCDPKSTKMRSKKY